MDQKPSGWHFLLSAPLAIICLALTDSPGWWQLPAMAIGATFAIIAVFTGIEWVICQVIANAAYVNQIRNTDHIVELAREMHNLPPEAVKVIDRSQRADVDAVVVGEELKFFLRGTDIDFGFLKDFLDHSEGMYLAPIRTWSEGSIGRLQAAELTKYFCHLNWAMDSNGGGNKPARWINGMTTWKVYALFFGIEGKEMKESIPSPTLPESPFLRE